MAPAHFKRRASFPASSPTQHQSLENHRKELLTAPSYQYSTQHMNPHAHQPPQLLIDGYIATMFGPRDTETYHSILLRREPRLLQPYNLTGYPGIFFANPPLRPDLDPRQQQTPWVIDYTVLNQGTVIKQQIYVPRIQLESLRPPIFFVHRNGGLGLPLNQAAGGDCMSLQGASHLTPLGACSTHAQIRINVSLTIVVHISRLTELKKTSSSGAVIPHGTTKL